MDYDVLVGTLEQWSELARQGLGTVIDPLVLRIGHLFLCGMPRNEEAARRQWEVIENNLGALVSFFDLVVLRDQFPAFNYYDTYDNPYGTYDNAYGAVENHVGAPSLEAVLNIGDKTLVHVDMEHELYKQVKTAALTQLRTRIAEGPLVPRQAHEEILTALRAVQYQWEPSLQDLELELPDPGDQQIARFLLGELVFTGYAQTAGSPHILAPMASRLLAAVGLRSARAAPSAEDEIYDELRRRIRDSGPGWRDSALPWAPSFLPFLLQRMNRYRQGPDVLLIRAKELREQPAISRYKKLQSDLSGDDAERSEEARRTLTAAADAVATSLDSGRPELEMQRHFVVEAFPDAMGAVSGGALGAVVGGPAGAAVGGLVGLVGKEALTLVQNKLWGWFLNDLPFRSARKLLARSVQAEYKLRKDLAPQLYAVWETGMRSS